MFYLSLSLALFLQFAVAELLGRSKHIGRWWMFFLLSSTFIIGGLIAWMFSPNAKIEPQKQNKIVSIIGVIILILGSLGLMSVLITFNTAFYVLSAPLSFIASGSYLMALGNGRVINTNPKYYFSWLKLNPSGLLSSFENVLKNKKEEITYYFVKEGENQKGPFTFQEVVNSRITEETLVWRRGMENFLRAGDIDEIKGAVVYLPPTTDQVELIEENESNANFNLSSDFQENESVIRKADLKTTEKPAETPAILIDVEKQNPITGDKVIFLYIIIATLGSVANQLIPALFSDSSSGTYWADNMLARTLSVVFWVANNCLFFILPFSIKNKNTKFIAIILATLTTLYSIFMNIKFLIYG
jgi:hypothetical protein